MYSIIACTHPQTHMYIYVCVWRVLSHQCNFPPNMIKGIQRISKATKTKIKSIYLSPHDRQMFYLV